MKRRRFLRLLALSPLAKLFTIRGESLPDAWCGYIARSARAFVPMPEAAFSNALNTFEGDKGSLVLFWDGGPTMYVNGHVEEVKFHDALAAEETAGATA